MIDDAEQTRIQKRWEALREDQKSTDAEGWQATVEMPGVWYHPGMSQFSYAPFAGKTRLTAGPTINWLRRGIGTYVQSLLDNVPLPSGAKICYIDGLALDPQPAYYDATFLASEEQRLAAGIQPGEKAEVFVRYPQLLNRDEMDALGRAGAEVTTGVYTYQPPPP